MILELYTGGPAFSSSAPWLIGGAGVVGGLLAGLLGIGGGVVSVPLLLALGIPPRFATASMTAAIVGNSAAATVYNAFRQSFSWTVGLWMGLGGAAGGLFGSWLVSRIHSPRALDMGISAGFLAVQAIALLLMFRRPATSVGRHPHALLRLPFLRVNTVLCNEPISLLVPIAAAIGVAVMGAFLGIGGALLLSPLLLSLCHSSLRQIIPVVQLTVLVGALFSASGHVFLSGNLDPGVALLLILGGTIGAPLGSRLKHRLSDRNLHRIYGLVILLAMVKVASGLFIHAAPALEQASARPELAGRLPVWLATVGLALVWGPLSAWLLRPRS
ncbi:MAG: sulfite exporter TauE/SafE family protein [Candidatus Delongbacteria bacterium]|nr:sulfite exporter TauE/SafE family protein [Candidatus Delongbacteria bacterium]